MDQHLIYFAAVLGLGIGAQWLAWRLKLPSILLLLGIGFAAGQFYDTSGILHQPTLLALVSLAVAVILLEGGLSLHFRELKDAGAPVLRLVSLGALVTWVLAAAAGHWVGGLSWPLATLLGAILTVTGPTVIGPLLRTIRPRRPSSTILKWEGIVIDPIGAILAVLVFEVISTGHGPGADAGHVLLGLAKTLAVGFGFGYPAARVLNFVIRHHWLPDYLQSVAVLAFSLVLFALSNTVQHESGLLTVTVIGLALANAKGAQVRHILEFKENLRVILISCLFIVLGGQVGLDALGAVWVEALLFLLVLIAIVRPASVFLSTAGTGLATRDKIFLSFMAPRGIVAAAVASVFALKLSEGGGALGAEAAKLVPVAFVIIVGTVAFYGLAGAPLARRLGLASRRPQGVLFAGCSPWVVEVAKELLEHDYRVLVVDSNYHATRAARMAGVPVLTANVLSEFATEETDLAGIGRVLAVTPNEHVNAMACMAFTHALGRSNVFQLATGDEDEDSPRKETSAELGGRPLFGKGVTHESLNALHRTGASVRSTLLTEEFGLEEFREEHGDKAAVLFVLRANGDLAVPTPEALNATAGDTLISLVPKA